MILYIRAKLAWLDAGSKGPEPNFTDYENGSHAAGWKPDARKRSKQQGAGRCAAVAPK
jgi:hypothetical protein